VVNDFTLDADASIFGFLGENGAGKTTVMKMIVGLLTPTSGTITIDGKPSASEEIKQRIGFMPETPYFYERFTGMEFLKFCDSLFGKNNRKKITPPSLPSPRPPKRLLAFAKPSAEQDAKAGRGEGAKIKKSLKIA